MSCFISTGNTSHQQPRSSFDPLDPLVQMILSQIAQKKDFSNAMKENKTQQSSHNSGAQESHKYQHAFTPKFDVFETSDFYHLEGEFPGLSDKNSIDLEFTSDNTLLIRGHIEKSKPSTTTITNKTSPQIEESKESKRKSLNPTVEDTEDEDDFSVVITSKNTKANPGKQQIKNLQEQAPYKIWLSERVCGDFKRIFSFPTPVNLDKVEARLDAGVLMVQVPKIKFTGVRKIEID